MNICFSTNSTSPVGAADDADEPRNTSKQEVRPLQKSWTHMPLSKFSGRMRLREGGSSLRWPRKMREMSACAAVPPLGFDHTHRCHHFTASYFSISIPSPLPAHPFFTAHHTPLVGFARRPRPETTPMHRQSSALSDTFNPVRSQPRASISPAARVLRPGSRRDHACLLL